MFSLKTAKVIGAPSGFAWSQVHDFKVEGEKLEKRGRLLMILSLSRVGEGIEAVTAGREVLARINEEYYGNLDDNPFERLKSTLEKLAQENEDLEVVAVVFYQQVGYFGILGKGKVVIKRETAIQEILGTVENNHEKKVLVGSGFVKENDVFLLASRGFFQIVAEGTWQAALGSGDPEEMVEVLAPIVAGREDTGAAAAVLIKTGQEIKLLAKEPILSTPLSTIPKSQPSLTKTKRQISWLAPLQKLFVSRAIFIRRRAADQQKRKKNLLAVAIILIFLLLASVVLGMRKREGEQERTKIDEMVARVENKLEEGRGLEAIKPVEARKSLKEAQGLVDELSQLTDDSQQIESLKKEITAELAKVVKEFRLTDPSIFFDLFLAREGAEGNDLGLLKDSLIVLDEKGSRVIEVDVKKKSARILAGGEELVGVELMSVYADKVYVFTPKGVLEVSTGKPETAIEKDDDWGEVIDMAVYGGSIYLLDNQKDMIWRYPVIESGFGAKQSWFENENLDLSKTTSFAIDGSLWVLNKGEPPIWKFLSGDQSAFSIIGLEKKFSSPTKIFTTETTENLYILDKTNYRVVVLDKEGNYLSSYLWTGIENVEDIMAIEEAKIILLLTGSEIYEIEIK